VSLIIGGRAAGLRDVTAKIDRRSEYHMPQLVKGGKYVFGWSLVDNTGRIAIPAEAGSEYNFKSHDKILILPGSKTSKGFAITTERLIKDTIFSAILKDVADMADARKSIQGFVEKNNKTYAWSEIDEEGCFTLDPAILQQYSVYAGDKLLAGRGSGFALAFIKQGSIVEEAQKHPELELFGWAE
jgi:hypothetical protein